MKKTLLHILFVFGAIAFAVLLCSCSGKNADDTSGLKSNSTKGKKIKTSENAVENANGNNFGNLIEAIQLSANKHDWTLVSDYIVPDYPTGRFVTAQLTGQIDEVFRPVIPALADALQGSDDKVTWTYDFDETADGKGSLTYTVKKSGVSDRKETVPIISVDGKWYINISDTSSKIPVTDLFAAEDLEKAETFQRGNLVGLCTTDQEELIRPYFNEIGGFTGEYCIVCKDEKYGFIDNKGNVISGCIFESAFYRPYEGYWWVQYNGKWGAVNFKKSITVPCQYDEAIYRGESKGYISVKNEDKCGLIKSDGTVLIPLQYDDIKFATSDTSVETDAVPVKKGDYWGIVDENNNQVVDFIFSDISDCYVKDRICVGINGSYGMIDRKGDYVIKISTDYTGFQMMSNVVVMKTDRYYKLFDYSGNAILSEYVISRKVESLNNDYCFVTSDGERGLENPDQYFIVNPDADCINLSEKIFQSLENTYPDFYHQAIKDYWSYYKVSPAIDGSRCFEVDCGLCCKDETVRLYNCISFDGELLIANWTTIRNRYEHIDETIIYSSFEAEDAYDYYLLNTQTHNSKKIGTAQSELSYYGTKNTVFWKT